MIDPDKLVEMKKYAFKKAEWIGFGMIMNHTLITMATVFLQKEH